MKLNQLPVSPAGRKPSKRKGRGMASGSGKTCGRGHKGQKSRSGGNPPVGFEGGQMPLQRRLPKRGFKNRFSKSFALMKVGDLEAFETGAEVKADDFRTYGLIGRRIGDGIKLLGDGTLSKSLHIHVDRVSKAARSKVEAAGGTVILTIETT